MKNNNFAFLIISLLFLTSCSYFSNDKEVKKKKALMEWGKNRESIGHKRSWANALANTTGISIK